MKIKQFVITILTSALLLGSTFGPVDVSAASASIVFGPGSLSTNPGGQVNTAVKVSSDQSVNSVDITVTFPASLMSAVKVDTSGTDFPSMFMGPPTINNSAGTIHFLQSKVGGTKSGTLGTITFQAKSTGSGSLKVTGGKIIANDGKGTNIYSGSSGATISVTAKPASQPQPTPPPSSTQQSFRPVVTGAPVISSTSHPDQNAWYKSRDVTISWSGGGSAYNFSFDQNATTQLPDKSAGSQTSATTTLANDGVWYAHVKALGSNGWSATSHFTLRADTKVPADFTPSTNPDGKGAVMPEVVFSSHDETSGIDRYEMKLDDGSWQKVASPFKVSKMGIGNHTIYVRAVDKAGNTSTGEVDYKLVAPNAPVITFPGSNQLFLLGQALAIKGTADPGVLVDIYLNDKKQDSVRADEDGNFISDKKFTLFAGAYKVMARAISADGISSAPSELVKFTLDATAVKLLGKAWPGWLVYTLVSMLIGFLAAVTGWLSFRLWHMGRVWTRRVLGLKQAVHEDLQKLEEQVHEEVDDLLAGNQSQAEAVKAEVSRAVDEAEDRLQKVGDDMLRPEPWLPILHGKDRFGEDKQVGPAKEEGEMSEVSVPAVAAAVGEAAVPDASIVYGDEGSKTAGAEGSKDPKNQETKEAAEASSVERLPTGQAGPVPNSQAANNSSPDAVAPPETRNPQPVAAVPPSVEATNNEASKDHETAAPTVDLFAPTITDAKDSAK